VSVTNKIAMTDLTEHLPARLNHPKELRTLKLRGILPKNAESNVQLSHYSLLHLEAPINGNTVYDFQSLVGWVRLLPNIKCLTCDLTELRYWFSNDLHNQYFDSFLQRLDRLYVNCSWIITREMNEELLTPLLQFLIDKDRLPQLRSLQFIFCKNILSAWTNIDQLIDFILSRIMEHQLTCVCFDFEQQKQPLTDLRTTDEIIRITEPSCFVYIHRFI
ncbi:unnamed protein product, partial [Rotaria magnacalcarata]